jgi:CheY-like chemotaxis protein
MTILLVEDNDDTRELLTFVFERHGAEILVAHDGAEALPLLAHGAPDVVVTDLSMPRSDGFDVLRATREILGDLPCIAISAAATGTERRRSLAAGFDEHLSKPVDYQVLLRAIVSLHLTHSQAARRGAVG